MTVAQTMLNRKIIMVTLKIVHTIETHEHAKPVVSHEYYFDLINQPA